MKNKKIVQHFSIVLIVSLFILSGCSDLFPEKDLTYQGETLVEFSPRDDTYNEDEGEIEVRVQLIGPQRDSDLSIDFSVNSSETDAVEGTHYDLITSSPVTIPANSSWGTITIDLNGTSLDEGESRVLVLTLEGGGGVEPAENLKTYTLTIEGVAGN